MPDPSKLFRRLAQWFTGSSSEVERTPGNPAPRERPPAAVTRPAIDPSNLFSQVPRWVLRPLPANANEDPVLKSEIDSQCANLPESFYQLSNLLDRVRAYREYDPAANRACAWVWHYLESICLSESPYHRTFLLEFAASHMTEAARARVIRRLAKDRDLSVRRRARRYIQRMRIREVAVPVGRAEDWTPAGWLAGVEPRRLFRQRPGRRMQAKLGLPEIGTVGDLRKLLGMKSRRQLGYFLLASDGEGGPYRRFTVPKRNGSDREICAPSDQLRWYQQQILRRILDKVPVHPAAHGFVQGRSTTSNATPHRGAQVVLKFDLKDFFPTVHYYRVVGLFASLGYELQRPQFSTADSSRQVAATLARLCVYTPDPTKSATGFLPQGAPTSPAISNLICRGLDARLDGLAKRSGGAYTRYADDLTFSFQDSNVDVGRFRWWVDQICHQEGFFVNQAKFRVIRRSQRQTVTGIVVNDELRVPRRLRRRFRAILHNCRQHGVASQSQGKPDFEGYLRGFASYIHMVHPEEGAVLLKQVNEVLSA